MNWDKLEQAMNEHRKEAFITCAPDCWCWHVEAALVEREADQQNVHRTGESLCAKNDDLPLGIALPEWIINKTRR
jgi:hypothetical protein